MLSPSLVLLSDQSALQRAVDVIANNVANASTTGFKREGIEFDTYISRPTTTQSLSFVTDRATYRDTSTGPILPTGNDLDLAIQGPGYFQVQMPDGSTKYTRGGAFHLDNEGRIVDAAGDPVMADGGQAITLPSTTSQINVSDSGFISARVDNGANLAQLGKLTVFTFDNEQQLQAQGNGLYATTQTPNPSANASIVQGSLESSNVKPVVEMTDLIKIQRSYEQTSNLISQENTRLSNAINILSKTTA
jgi:flagellar basal-body rod protein FlgF